MAPPTTSSSRSNSCKSEQSLANVPSDSKDHKPFASPESSTCSLGQAELQADTLNEPNWPSGIKPYTCLFGCFLLMFNSWGLVNAYGTFQSYYKQHLFAGRSLLLLNLIGSTESFVVLIFSFVVGRLLDAGYYRYLTGCGTILVTIAMFTLGLANSDVPHDQLDHPGQNDRGNYPLTWLTQGLLLGLGMACFFVSSSQIAATWFKKRKSFAIGIVASGASIAGMVYPMMTKYIIAVIGFRRAVFCVAGVVAFTATLSFILAVPNPNHEFRKPERWLQTRVWVDTQAFRNRSFTWFVASISLMFFGFYAIFFNLEEWAAYEGFGYKDSAPDKIDYQPSSGVTEVHKDALRTFYLLSIMNGCSTLGRLGAAYLSDHFGALNIHAIVSSVAALLVLLLWTLASRVSSAVIFVVLFGAVSGAVIGLPPASVAYILGPNQEQQRKLGQWTGMMYTVAAPFALTGPVIAGHLVAEFGENYKTVQLWSGFCLLLSGVCQMVAIYYRQTEKNDAGSLKRWLSSATSVRFFSNENEKSSPYHANNGSSC